MIGSSEKNKGYVTIVAKEEKLPEVEKAIKAKNVKIIGNKPKAYQGNAFYYFEVDVEYSKENPSKIQKELVLIQDTFLGIL